jgi:Helix-turn-helix domain
MAATDELACTTLEKTLPVTKSTISYHIKALVHAHLIHVRKQGRYYFYTLRRDMLAIVVSIMTSELIDGEPEPDQLASTPLASRIAREGSNCGRADVDMVACDHPPGQPGLTPQSSCRERLARASSPVAHARVTDDGLAIAAMSLQPPVSRAAACSRA